MRLVTPAQMRQMDATTIDTLGLPGVILMERAALGAVEVALSRFALRPGDRVGVLCGGGNNGGDGLATARLLSQRGLEVALGLLVDPASLQGDAALNMRAAQALALPMHFLHDAGDDLPDKLQAMGRCALWIDALLGTGLNRAPSAPFAGAIAHLNRQQRVLALDLPSGVEGDSGRARGLAARASVTATFALPKLGLALEPGRALAGEVVVVEIGIPAAIIDQVGTEAEWLDAAWARGRLPARAPDAHKGTSGRALIVAGSHTMTGAALLSARGALEGGAGLITLACQEAMLGRFGALPEVMTALIPEEDDERDALLARADAVLIGPGLGDASRALAWLERALALDANANPSGARAARALVLDADALRASASLADMAERLRLASQTQRIVLTPHPGEMAALCDTTTARVLDDPLTHARILAHDTGCVVVLKLSTTIIAAPEGRLAISAAGNPGMATGGMGDALAGIIAAQLMVMDDAFDASCAGVYAHGAAGDRARAAYGERGVTPTRLMDQLGAVWRLMEATR